MVLVAPRAGAWIETYMYVLVYYWSMSRPARARGLKQYVSSVAVVITMSRPARARGLKQDNGAIVLTASQVAPRAGAWIETPGNDKTRRGNQSRAPRGRVD